MIVVEKYNNDTIHAGKCIRFYSGDEGKAVWCDPVSIMNDVQQPQA